MKISNTVISLIFNFIDEKYYDKLYFLFLNEIQWIINRNKYEFKKRRQLRKFKHFNYKKTYKNELLFIKYFFHSNIYDIIAETKYNINSEIILKLSRIKYKCPKTTFKSIPGYVFIRLLTYIYQHPRNLLSDSNVNLKLINYDYFIQKNLPFIEFVKFYGLKESIRNISCFEIFLYKFYYKIKKKQFSNQQKEIEIFFIKNPILEKNLIYN